MKNIYMLISIPLASVSDVLREELFEEIDRRAIAAAIITSSVILCYSARPGDASNYTFLGGR